MIIEWLLDFIEGGFNLLIGLFPETSFNPVDMLSNGLSFMGGLNYFLPISEMVAAIVAFLLLGLPFMGVTLGVWVVAFIRGGSARA